MTEKNIINTVIQVVQPISLKYFNLNISHTYWTNFKLRLNVETVNYPVCINLHISKMIHSLYKLK